MVLTFYTFCCNKKPSASPQAFYCSKMCKKSKSPPFSYYQKLCAKILGWTEVGQICGGSSYKAWKEGWQPYKAHTQVPLKVFPIFPCKWSAEQPCKNMMNTQRWPRGAAPLLHPPCRHCLQSDKGTGGELDLTKVFCLTILLFCHTSVSHCRTKVKMYAGPIIIIFAFSLLVAFLLCQVAPFLFPFSFQLHNLCSLWFISRTTWVLTGHFYRHLSALAGATSEEEADWAGGEAGCWWEGGLQRRGRPCTPGRGASCQIKRNHKYEREEKTLISYVGEGGEKVHSTPKLNIKTDDDECFAYICT